MNLLKADLYRLIKEKSIYICSVAMFLLILVNSIILRSVNKIAPIMTEITTVQNIMTSSVSGLFFVLLISISVALFHSKEYTYNTIRHKVTCGESRIKIIVIKSIETIIITTYFYLLAVILSLVIGSMFFEFKFQDNYAVKIISQYVLVLGISSIVNLLIILTKSSKRTILITVLLFSITNLIGQFLPSLSENAFVKIICRTFPTITSSIMLKSNPEGIMKYFLLLGNSEEIVYGYMYLNALLSGFLYLIGATTAAVLRGIKQEYK